MNSRLNAAERGTTVIIRALRLPPLGVHFHPEIGWVADDNGGAQSKGCAYDQGQQVGGNNLARWVASVFRDGVMGNIDGTPCLIAELASDGWWWRVTRPETYGLPPEQRNP